MSDVKTISRTVVIIFVLCILSFSLGYYYSTRGISNYQGSIDSLTEQLESERARNQELTDGLSEAEQRNIGLVDRIGELERSNSVIIESIGNLGEGISGDIDLLAEIIRRFDKYNRQSEPTE